MDLLGSSRNGKRGREPDQGEHGAARHEERPEHRQKRPDRQG